MYGDGQPMVNEEDWDFLDDFLGEDEDEEAENWDEIEEDDFDEDEFDEGEDWGYQIWTKRGTKLHRDAWGDSSKEYCCHIHD